MKKIIYRKAPAQHFHLYKDETETENLEEERVVLSKSNPSWEIYVIETNDLMDTSFIKKEKIELAKDTWG